ncbi:PAS domain-containing sensor histidine kinase [Methylocapsa sp. S129]|uniref:sensor histidine kinase n=1 Tax=Methylocapsa sp. S129 TaxID=1641869 RepID=UPI00131DB8E0|nr:PAS domain-containing sensor histidine kinase [Methylocapsa sp. S129]
MDVAKRELIFGLPFPWLLASLFATAGLLGLVGAEYAALMTTGGGLSGPLAVGLAAWIAICGVALAVGARKIRAMGRRTDLAGATPYDAIAAATGDLILRLDSSGGALSISLGARDVFGRDVGELTGRGFFDRVHVGDRPSLLQAIGAALQREGAIGVTLRLRTGSRADPGQEFDEPVFSNAEMRIHRLGDALANANDRSGAAVVCVVRSVAKNNGEKHAAASAEAESDSSWKDRLLANVSHELRTPLNAIIGFSEILGSAELAPRDAAKQLEYAGIIHASAEHLLSVVNLILDMSKIEARRFSIMPEPFDVGPLIASCCDMLRLKADEGGVELVQAPLDIPRELIADKRACRQILINLLSNAVKFTKPNGRVTIGARVEGDSLVIYVDDTGIGIAPGHFSKLGNPFFQVRSSYDRMFEGTGLGLSLVRGLVGLHGGSLLLESVVEEGTRVAVRLPLDCRGKAPTDSAPAPIEILPSLTRSSPDPLASYPASHHATKEKRIA